MKLRDATEALRRKNEAEERATRECVELVESMTHVPCLDKPHARHGCAASGCLTCRARSIMERKVAAQQLLPFEGA